MAVLTSILSSDIVSASRATINSNLNALNLEAGGNATSIAGQATFAASIVGQATFASSIVSQQTFATSILGHTTFGASIVGHTSSIASKLEQATAAQVLTGTSSVLGLTPLSFTGNVQRIYKSADETVNNSNVLQDDDHLLFAVGANEVWAFNFINFFTSGTTPDFKFGYSIPSGATIYGEDVNFYYIGNGTSHILSGEGATVSRDFGSAVVINGATPGNVVFQWAQNTANMSDTKVLKGSYIIAHRLA